MRPSIFTNLDNNLFAFYDSNSITHNHRHRHYGICLTERDGYYNFHNLRNYIYDYEFKILFLGVRFDRFNLVHVDFQIHVHD